MPLYVLSWNMQGWSQGAKADALNWYIWSSFNNDDQIIILLQECGSPRNCRLRNNTIVEWNDDFTCVRYMPDPTADDQRCSVAVLASNNIGGVNGGIETIGVNRVLMYVRCNNGVVATIHAPSGVPETVPYVNSALDICKRVSTHNPDNIPDHDPNSWLLMGDFNSNPNNYNLNGIVLFPEVTNFIIYDGSHFRPKNCDMIYSANNTQGANGIRVNLLDFAFMGHNGYFSDNLLQNNGLSFINRTMTSDHNLIGLQFNNQH